MNERELKKKVNDLRHEIEKRDKDIKNLYNEINIYKKEADELRLKRDQAKESIKISLGDAKVFLNKRDELNKEVAELKKKRKKLSDKIKKLSGDIKNEKIERDELNKDARGTKEILIEIYEDKLKKILEDEIHLEDEIQIFNKLFEIKERLKTVEKADDVHKKISKDYEKIQKLNKNFDSICKKIKSIAEESQESHERAMQIYYTTKWICSEKSPRSIIANLLRNMN